MEFNRGIEPVSESKSQLIEKNLAEEGGNFGDWVGTNLQGVNNSLMDKAKAAYDSLWDKNLGKKISGYDAQKYFPQGEYEATKQYTMAEAITLQNNVVNRTRRDTIMQRQDRGMLMDFPAMIASELVADPFTTAVYAGLATATAGMGVPGIISGSRMFKAYKSFATASPIMASVGKEVVENVGYSLVTNTFRNEFLTSVTPPQDYTGSDFANDVFIGAGVGAIAGAIGKRYRKPEIMPAKNVTNSPQLLLSEFSELPAEFHQGRGPLYDDGYGAKIHSDRDVEAYAPLHYGNEKYNAKEIDANLYIHAQETSFTPFGRGVTMGAQPLYGSSPDVKRISATLVDAKKLMSFDPALVGAIVNTQDLSPKGKEFAEFLGRQYEEMTRNGDITISRFLSEMQDNLANEVYSGNLKMGEVEGILDNAQAYFVSKGIDGINDGNSVHIFDQSLRLDKNKNFHEEGSLSMQDSPQWNTEARDQMGLNEIELADAPLLPEEQHKIDLAEFYSKEATDQTSGVAAYDPILGKYVTHYKTKPYDLNVPVDYSVDIPENMIKHFDDTIEEFSEGIRTEFDVLNANIEIIIKNEKIADKYFKLKNAIDDHVELRSILEDKTIDAEFENFQAKKDWLDAKKEAKAIIDADTTPATKKKKQKELEERARKYDRTYGKALMKAQEEKLAVLNAVDDNATNIMKYERDVFQEIQEEIKDSKEFIKNQEKVLRALTICMFRGK